MSKCQNQWMDALATPLMEIVSVNPLGYVVGLSHTMAFGITTKRIANGIYFIDRREGAVDFIPWFYAHKEMDNTTFQLPMPEFGV